MNPFIKLLIEKRQAKSHLFIWYVELNRKLVRFHDIQEFFMIYVFWRVLSHQGSIAGGWRMSKPVIAPAVAHITVTPMFTFRSFSLWHDDLQKKNYDNVPKTLI